MPESMSYSDSDGKRTESGSTRKNLKNKDHYSRITSLDLVNGGGNMKTGGKRKVLTFFICCAIFFFDRIDNINSDNMITVG